MRVYLDHNATTPVAPEVLGVIERELASGPLNPGSPHTSGRAALAKLETARDRVLAILGLRDGYRVVFCASATEAANIAIRGQPEAEKSKVALLSAVEHPAVMQAAASAWKVKTASVRGDGCLDLEDFTRQMASATLAAVMFANNETGALHPVEEIVALCRERQLPLLVDCCQAPGKTGFFEVIARARPEMILLSGHKLHAPVGIAALILAPTVRLRGTHFGGGQQYGLRPGTEPVALALGFAEALELAHRRFDEEKLRKDVQMLWDAVRAAAPDAEQTVPQAGSRLANTLHYRIPGLSAERQIMALDLAGVECSSASACESGSAQPSKVLLAMGYSPREALEGVRLSVSRQTSGDDITFACKAITATLGRLLRSDG